MQLNRQDSDYDEEADAVSGVLSDINRIQAHNSPVLIIQRYVRGFLIRKIVQFDRDLKNWWVRWEACVALWDCDPTLKYIG